MIAMSHGPGGRWRFRSRNEHRTLLVSELILAARYQNVQKALWLVALIVVVHHMQEPNGTAIVMDASCAVLRVVGLAFGTIAEVAH